MPAFNALRESLANLITKTPDIIFKKGVDIDLVCSLMTSDFNSARILFGDGTNLVSEIIFTKQSDDDVLESLLGSRVLTMF